MNDIHLGYGIFLHTTPSCAIAVGILCAIALPLAHICGLKSWSTPAERLDGSLEAGMYMAIYGGVLGALVMCMFGENPLLAAALGGGTGAIVSGSVEFALCRWCF